MTGRFPGGHPPAGGAGKAEARHPEGMGARRDGWREPARTERGRRDSAGERRATGVRITFGYGVPHRRVSEGGPRS